LALVDLPRSADVVIVGGGVIGTSIAFHLAEAGADVVLLERGDLGAGSTSKAAGGVRGQFSDSLNVEIGKRSLDAFAAFGSRPGWEIDFKQVGYLFALRREEDLEAFSRNAEMQRRHGVPTEILTPAEAAALCPLLAVDDLAGAAFSSSDGHATPDGVVQGYAAGARAHGARLLIGCTVEGIVVDRRRVTGVITDRGQVKTGVVVCAAGAWSGAVGEMVRCDLPVVPLRRQILFTEPIADLPADLPMTIDFESTFYFHREGPGLLIGMSDPDERPGFNLENTDDWIPKLIAAAERRAPRVARAGIKGGWAGLYEVTPDHNALIGEAPEVSRFLYATGFSGHGFLQAPGTGEIVRDLVLGRPPVVDVAPLSAERFDRAGMRRELNVV
jgi:sarcosine oxidase, subunit beta